AGCDTFVSGSGIFGKANASDANRYDSIIKQMRDALASA
ncbi:Ribulose-phosphate 3-epimerase, partial [hydrothermal vent metagenome]